MEESRGNRGEIKKPGLCPAQSVKKVEVQEALPPAGVIGAEPLALVPQHLPPQTSVALFGGTSGQLGFFDRLSRGYARHTVKTAVSAHPAARRHFTQASAVAPVVYTSSSSRIFSPVKSRTAAKAPSMAVSRWARFRST